MSTDPHPRGGRRNRRAPSGTAIAIAAVVLAILVAVLALVLLGGDGSDVAAPEPSLTASPLPVATAPSGPGDAAAATFARSYMPPGGTDVQHVQADLDADGVPEVVFASILEAQQSVRVDVGAWTGAGYEIVFTGQGGAADSYELTVRDYTGDAFPEVVTEQSIGAQGASLSVWGWDGVGLSPQVAVGGCWAGSNTYGIIGARIEPQQIVATCDGSPLPTAAWPSDVYVWDGRTWAYERSLPA